MAKCISCKKDTQDVIGFNCPKCKVELFRCARCRTLSVDYKCVCGFEGP